MHIADIGDVDLHAILDAGDVEQVAAVLGNQTVHQDHVRTEVH